MKNKKRAKKNLAILIFILYLFLVWFFFIDRGLIVHKLFNVYFTFIRPFTFHTANFTPSLSTMLDEGKTVLILNLTAFIPMGFFICAFTKGKNKFKHIYLTLLIPILIETLQYIFATGAFDVNDIILNFISSIIGVLIYAIFKRITKHNN